MTNSKSANRGMPLVDEDYLDKEIAIFGAEFTWPEETVRRHQQRFREELSAYRELPLNDKIQSIDDERIMRLCQVLTNYGFRTISSCEGHGSDLPSIFFVCDNNELLRDLAYIINHGSPYKKFQWSVAIESPLPSSNPHSPLRFQLKPFADFDSFVLPRDYEELMRDMDIIALCIMEYFDSQYESEAE